VQCWCKSLLVWRIEANLLNINTSSLQSNQPHPIRRGIYA
jgi:hypothetical protein